MIHDIRKNTTGEIISIPALTENERQDVNDFLEEAKRVKDEEGIYIVNLLLEAITRLEAGTRNMARTLNVYRNTIPRLMRITNNKIKQEEEKK